MKKYALLLGGVLALAACKKNEDATPAAPSRTDLLTAHAWKVSAQTTTFATAGSTATSSTIDACSQDDFYRFNTSQSFVADEGATKCDPTDPQQQTGTWAFSNSDQTKLQLTLPGSAFNGDIDIKELTASKLHLYTSQTSGGVSITVDATLVPN